MNLDNKAILDAVLQTLREDEQLASYVKKITHGAAGFTQMIYPFVEVRDFIIRPELVRAGSAHFIYTIEIVAGARSLVPGAAYIGSEAGTRGINHLCDDLCDAVRGKTFNGLLNGVYDITNNPNYRRDKGETIHLGLVTFKGLHISHF